jgi:hypothetical protein
VIGVHLLVHVSVHKRPPVVGPRSLPPEQR